MIECVPVETRMNRVMLDLELLRSFVSVIDAGDFTRAGERVHRTQSTVSQQIRRLEETLAARYCIGTKKHQADRRGRAVAFLCAADSRASRGGSRRGIAPERGWCGPAGLARGLCRVSPHGNVIGIRPLASGPASLRALWKERSYATGTRTRRNRPCAI